MYEHSVFARGPSFELKLLRIKESKEKEGRAEREKKVHEEQGRGGGLAGSLTACLCS